MGLQKQGHQMQKTILITGCSSGIGLDAARSMRDRGWRVFASCRKEKDCDRLRAEGFDSPRIDYTEADSISSGLANVLQATGGTLMSCSTMVPMGCPARLRIWPPRGCAKSLKPMFVAGTS